MTIRKIPREVYIRFMPVIGDPSKTHNVLEVCGKYGSGGVRFVMAQDSETAKERDKYKLRSALQADRIAELKAENEQLSAQVIRTQDHAVELKAELQAENKALREAAQAYMESEDKGMYVLVRRKELKMALQPSKESSSNE